MTKLESKPGRPGSTGQLAGTGEPFRPIPSKADAERAMVNARLACRGFEDEIATIGRNKVAKAIEFGAYLNELYAEHFGTRYSSVDGRRLPKREQPRYWKRWSATVKEWGLNEKTLSSYRVLASEAGRSPTVSLTEFSSVTQAVTEARRLRKERRLADAEQRLEQAKAKAEASRADRDIEVTDTDVERAERAHENYVREQFGHGILDQDDEGQRLERVANGMRAKHGRKNAARQAAVNVGNRERELERLRRTASRHGAVKRPEFSVRFWLNEDGTLGYQHARGGSPSEAASGVVDGFATFWQGVSALLDVPGPGSDAWKFEVGRFVADATAAHVRNGLAMVEAEDADALAEIMHRPTSTEEAELFEEVRRAAERASRHSRSLIRRRLSGAA